MELRYSSPDDGLYKALRLLRDHGVRETSRNGPVLRLHEPVLMINEAPQNRVSKSYTRDANPFFHFMEALWMLGGMNDVESVARYNGGISQYSDDGKILKGTAYGYKWRTYFGYDQLDEIITQLRANPETRRLVLTMWDPRLELKDKLSKDLSCNLQVIFSTRIGVVGKTLLDMTVTNRSNDVVYGCFGSNLFHFSFLLEYVASQVGMEVGKYYHFSNNLHGYLENPVFVRCFRAAAEDKPAPGEDGMAGDFYRVSAPSTWLTDYPLVSQYDIQNFVRTGNVSNQYLIGVAKPIYEAWRIFKLKSEGIEIPAEQRIQFAQSVVNHCADTELREACWNWLDRRWKDSPDYQAPLLPPSAPKPYAPSSVIAPSDPKGVYLRNSDEGLQF